MFSFKHLMGSVPKSGRTETEVQATAVMVKKEDRIALASSDRLKISKAARGGGRETFTFFKMNGKIVGDFESVYNLHMHIESLNKDLLFYDMKDLFDIITESTIQRLKIRLTILLGRQIDLQKSNEDLTQDLLNNGFSTSAAAAAKAVNETEWLLEAIEIRPVDLIKSFRDLNESEIRQLNKY